MALVFDFLNGFHDAANCIATVVSTGVLRPYQAVMWAAFFNFIAIAIFELKVAATVGKGIISPEFVDQHVIFGALVGAITWNLITWYYGIPSSSSHALIGGMIGAAMAKAGTAPLVTAGHPQDHRVHRDLADARAAVGLAADARGVVDLLPLLARGAWIGYSAGCSWFRPRSTAWATAATTRRRPWASSGCC